MRRMALAEALIGDPAIPIPRRADQRSRRLFRSGNDGVDAGRSRTNMAKPFSSSRTQPIISTYATLSFSCIGAIWFIMGRFLPCWMRMTWIRWPTSSVFTRPANTRS